MNLTLGDARDLPLAAALLHGEDVVAATAEWGGAGPGTVTYGVRRARLLVATREAAPAVAAMCRMLLQALDDAADSSSGVAALQLRMLAESLRLLSGAPARPGGAGAPGVLDLAIAGIAARTGVNVSVRSERPCEVSDPAVAALVVVQLAVNAERHDDASSVVVEHDPAGLHVEWRGRPSAVRTSRRRRNRDRWGLGFARIAADRLGATLHPPHRTGETTVRATLELGVPRLALPLAGLRGGSVERATRTWDEETGLPAGSSAHVSARLGELIAAARRQPGRIAALNGWQARTAGSLLWVAIPPDDGDDRARDVVSGLAHEEVLLRGTDPLHHATIRGLALLLARALGTPLPLVTADGWRRRLEHLAMLSGTPITVPACNAAGAVDADATWVLASRGGARFDAAGDRLVLRTGPGRAEDPLLQAVVSADGCIPIA